jgi:flagellar biosynthesis protein FlhB
MEEKTLPASERRRREAREAGVVARSADVCAMSVIAGVALLAMLAGSAAVDALGNLIREGLTARGEDVMEILSQMTAGAAWMVLPVGGLALGIGVLANTAQVGWHWGRQQASGPAFSVRRVLFGAAYLLAVAAVFGWTVWICRERIFSIHELGGVLGFFGVRALIALSVIALVDYALARRRVESALALSPAEAAEEVRQTEGNPRLRDRRRRMHQDFVRGAR